MQENDQRSSHSLLWFEFGCQSCWGELHHPIGKGSSEILAEEGQRGNVDHRNWAYIC